MYYDLATKVKVRRKMTKGGFLGGKLAISATKKAQQKSEMVKFI